MPIDLDATTTTIDPMVGVPPAGDDPNAEARQQVEDIVRDQCLSDPDREEGVVQFNLDGEVVNEYRVPCDEIRAEANREADEQ